MVVASSMVLARFQSSVAFGYDCRQVRQCELIRLPPFPIARTPLFGDPYEAKGLDFADTRANCVPAHAEFVKVAVCHRQLAVLLASW